MKGKHHQAQLKFQLQEKVKISFVKFLIGSDGCKEFPSLEKEGLGVVGPGFATVSDVAHQMHDIQ